MGLRARGSRRLAPVVPVALCVLVITLSFAYVRNGADDAGPSVKGRSAADERTSAVDDGGGGDVADDVTRWPDWGDEQVREAMDSRAEPSSSDEFLDDLSCGDESVEAVEWMDDRGLEHAGREALGAYEEAGASMRMNGFLDLHGTAWGALLEGDGWVDVVSVVGQHEGAATVRVARINAE